MNAHLNVLATLGTLAVIGIDDNAYSDEYSAKENEQQYQVFAKDYANGYDRPLFSLNRPQAVSVPNVLRHPVPAIVPVSSQNPHWGPAEDATSRGS
ncbi:hypothetical protein V5F32_08625 [Xanthobacter oligotrophicus]|uniref:Uncharacterized protein n=1 Tax=Xanthobacter oligotrophicus TaxID=2607286 RepID=A0ABW6ZU10_9HYPH